MHGQFFQGLAMKRKTTPQLIQRTDGFAREAERYVITGVPCSTWRKLQDEDLAPRPVHLSPRSVGWLRSELFAWCQQRLANRRATWTSEIKSTDELPA
jgi:prophage regulatory protein